VSVSEWREVRIGDIGDVVTGKTPSSKNPEYFGDEIPFVTPTDYKNYHKNIYSSERYLSQAGKEVLGNKLLPINSVIVTCIGSDMGKVAINKVECITNQQINSIILKRDLADSDFIYYTLISMQEYLKMLARGGTTMPIVNKSTFEEIKLLLPPFPEQKAIAATLSVLDDMIELNNQINKTLEEMAQAIFKSWFVDFEPFRDGEFEESEIGPIPKGWRVVELGEITEEIRERVKDRKIPVFSAVKTGDLVLSEDYFTKQVFSRDISKYIVVKPFDFAYNPARINIGSIGINEFSYTGCVSPVYVVFRTDQKYKWFFKMLTRTERFKKEVNTRASGSVRQTLNFDEFSKIKVVYPYAEIVEEYNYIFEGLIMAKSKIEEEISILSEIRDTLLPKLMSGEIRVPVEEVI